MAANGKRYGCEFNNIAWKRGDCNRVDGKRGRGRSFAGRGRAGDGAERGVPDRDGRIGEGGRTIGRGKAFRRVKKATEDGLEFGSGVG